MMDEAILGNAEQANGHISSEQGSDTDRRDQCQQGGDPDRQKDSLPTSASSEASGPMSDKTSMHEETFSKTSHEIIGLHSSRTLALNSHYSVININN